MADKLTQQDNTLIVGFLTQARDRSNQLTIENQLLDGTFVVQSIGSPHKTIDVEFYCTKAVRRQLDGYASETALLNVFYEDLIWSGYIRGGQVSWDWFSDTEERVTFTFLVLEETSQ